VEESSPNFGLKEDWSQLEKTLEEIVPVYDKTNRYISLGTDLKLRKRGIKLLLSEFGTEDFSLMDLGCGTGTMTQLFQTSAKSNDRVTLVDALPSMLKVARQRVGQEGVLGVYEALPFRTAVVDAAMSGFAIRDAKDLKAALDQINRILKPNGKFLIVDLAKPDSSLRSGLISIYWRIFAPLIAFFSVGKLGWKFAALSKTYRRLPKISELIHLAEVGGFEITRSEFSMLGGASVLLLSKRF
jgi:demethylmenaquinone methyltransferase / 2-methoxy-6-polyprenyl-1,4-benzoquinol methylase